MIKKQQSIQNIALNFIKNKNNKNFTQLVNRLKPGLFAFAYNFLKDTDLAKEVVSQTFITVWEKIDQYNAKYNFSTWVYAIAKNASLGILRLQNKNISLDNDIFFNSHSRLLHACNLTFNINTEVLAPVGEDLTQYLYDASIAAIYKLSEPYRSVMIEREINQLQLSDIATALGMNLSTVKTRLRKARKDVAEILYKTHAEEIDTYFNGENNE